MKPTVKYSLLAAFVLIVAATFYMKSTKVDQVGFHEAELVVKKTAGTLAYPKKDGEVTAKTPAPFKKEMPANPYLTKESLEFMPVTMKEFLLLDMKVVKNAEETKKFYGLLRSPAALGDAQKVLLSMKNDNVTESEREHFTATRFLARAMGDLSNKSNKALNEMVKKIILEDNLSGSIPANAKLVFAGDKAELAQVYIAFNQNSHQELMSKTKNPNIKKIVENAYNYNESVRVSN